MNTPPPEWQNLNVILAHDWLTGMRGGERVLEILCRAFPRAPIYTLFHNPSAVSATINSHRIITSWLQNVPGIMKFYRNFLPFFPSAIESLRPDRADLIISTSHCVAKGLIAPAGARHLCYCFTPMRYAWVFYDEYFGNNPLKKAVLTPLLRRLRQWDKESSARVDYFVTLSKHVRKRIKDFYGRDAKVVYPPVDLSFWTPALDNCSRPRRGPGFAKGSAEASRSGVSPSTLLRTGDPGYNFEIPMPEHGFSDKPHEDYDLVVSALVPYKRIDIAVKAYTKLGHPLEIVGTGTETAKLTAMAGKNVVFLGRVPDDRLLELYRHCRALIFPGEEDFGLTPVEAFACGKPVVACAKGGVLETAVKDLTGIFFEEQNEDALLEAVQKCAGRKWDSAAIRNNAERFSEQNFLGGLSACIEECLATKS